MSQSSATHTAKVERFLRHSRIAGPLADGLHKEHAKAVAEPASSPAGWHGPDDIETLEGLGGTYLWSENLPEVEQISFRFDPEHVGSQGTYELTGSLGTLERGTFHCVPNNPAIGWASIALVPADSSQPRPLVVAGMFTDANWKIQILLLNKVAEQGLVQPPFSANRMS